MNSNSPQLDAAGNIYIIFLVLILEILYPDYFDEAHDEHNTTMIKFVRNSI